MRVYSPGELFYDEKKEEFWLVVDVLRSRKNLNFILEMISFEDGWRSFNRCEWVESHLSRVLPSHPGEQP